MTTTKHIQGDSVRTQQLSDAAAIQVQSDLVTCIFRVPGAGFKLFICQRQSEVPVPTASLFLNAAAINTMLILLRLRVGLLVKPSCVIHFGPRGGWSRGLIFAQESLAPGHFGTGTDTRRAGLGCHRQWFKLPVANLNCRKT